ncbi:hypothetical protein SADUNF_Sadunf19G0076400 [Salix dunnii]|uniref:Uncharacterized protein n=1 Tax=Salix dunnii TaxID=1413687 RepID=A0A835J620_9ROSI|nr:hypothetical protein SADUNF_Sadunf19G0076400 [Salix dunnii]
MGCRKPNRHLTENNIAGIYGHSHADPTGDPRFIKQPSHWYRRVTELTQLNLITITHWPNSSWNQQAKKAEFLESTKLARKLTSTVPDFSLLAFLARKLAYRELVHNALTGTIPSFLGNFRALDTFFFGRTIRCPATAN